MSHATAQQPHPAAVGDLMTALVQPRHIKLGLAGNEQNWPYAAYGPDQLRETFKDLAESLPKYRDLSIPDMITSMRSQAGSGRADGVDGPRSCPCGGAQAFQCRVVAGEEGLTVEGCVHGAVGGGCRRRSLSRREKLLIGK